MSPIKAQGLWHLSAVESRIAQVPLTTQRVIIRAKFSSVSVGTERLVSTGALPADAHEVMRVPYMEGTFDFPCTYGYSLVGVEEGSGRLVHVMHPHQSMAAVFERDIFYVEEKIPAERVTFLSNMETAVTIFWDANPMAGEKILILGAGLIGILTASVLSAADISFSMYDPDATRASFCETLGFDKHYEGDSYDLIIDTTGNPEALQYAIDCSNKHGRIIVAGWTGNQRTTACLGGAFHYHRLTIKSSQVSSIPLHKQKEWDHLGRKKLCLEYLRDDFYDRLIDNVVEFQDLPGEFQKIRRGNYPHLSIIVKY